MKILKSILSILGGLILLALLISFFLPSKVHVERTAVVKGNPEVVFKLVNNLKDWEKWSPWHRLDAKMKIEYSEAVEGKGAHYSWKSDHSNVGNGKLTITESKPDEYVKTEMNFDEGNGTGEFFLRPVDKGTEVKWTMDTDMGMNPIGKFMGLLMDNIIGADYEKGLHYLDSVAQITKLDPYKMTLELGSSPATKIIVMKANGIKEAELGPKLGEIYGKIEPQLAASGLVMAGAPLAIYESPQDGLFTFEAGIPVDKAPTTKLPTGVFYKELPPSEAVICHFSGPYELTGAAYGALENFMKQKNKTVLSNPYESYVSDPMTAKNPLDIKTDIYWPVK